MRAALLLALAACGGDAPSYDGTFAGQMTVTLVPAPSVTDSGVYFYDTTITLAESGASVTGTLRATTTNTRVVSPIDATVSATSDGTTFAIEGPALATGCGNLSLAGTASLGDGTPTTLVWNTSGTLVCNSTSYMVTARPSSGMFAKQ